MDLCSLAETCKCFRQIVQRISPKQLSITDTYQLEAKSYLHETSMRNDVIRSHQEFRIAATWTIDYNGLLHYEKRLFNPKSCGETLCRRFGRSND